jgi:hypothetical protein
MKKTTTILAVLLCCITYAQIPTNGLRTWLPFSGNSVDASGNNNSAVNYGATLTSDRDNIPASAYYFDGTDSMTIENFIGLPTGASPFTVSVWFNTVNWNYRGTMYGWGIGSSGGGQSNVLRTGEEAGGSLVHYFWLNDLTTGTTDLSGSWHNAIVTYNGNNRVLYLDGVSIGNDLAGAAGVVNTTVTIGSGAVVPGAPGSDNFVGKLDDIGVWNRALTPQEVQQVYGGGSGNPCIYTDTVEVFDTTHVTVYDTTHVTIYDTTHVTVFDTIYLTSSTVDTLIIDVATSIAPPNNANTLKVYPNPAKDHLIINNGNLAAMTGYSIKITNALGQIVFNQPVNQQQFYIDLSSWGGSGTYFLYVIDAQQTVKETKEIVLQ